MAEMKIQPYLEYSEFINHDDKHIKEQARILANNSNNELGIVKNCFEYVRDAIKHSYDYKLNPVTCKASDVLKYKTGYCYAKSHLLAALLRANNIPAGLCYQRLSIDGKGSPFCLHGLNVVYLKEYGWYRVDARGNNESIKTDFNPPHEHLAYKSNVDIGEVDLLEIYNQPLQVVIDVLTSKTNYLEVSNNLPYIETII
jgi:transglutaminase-like putative cysteine protease